jgi:hypothetical protein
VNYVRDEQDYVTLMILRLITFTSMKNANANDPDSGKISPLEITCRKEVFNKTV